MTQTEEITITEQNKLFIAKTENSIRELLPGKLPIEVKAVLKEMQFIEARTEGISKLVKKFPHNTKAIGSIIIQNAVLGLTYSKDYWITPQGKEPLFQFKAEGFTKLLQTHSRPIYTPASPIITGCVYEGEIYEYDNIKGMLSHSQKEELRTGKIEDIIGAYAQYKTSNGTVIAHFITRQKLEVVRRTSANAKAEKSPWQLHPAIMCIVKAIKGLCKQVQHSGGFDRTKALLAYLAQDCLAQDEMIIDAEGNPSVPPQVVHRLISKEQAQELDTLCNNNCKQVINKYNIQSFFQLDASLYEEVKKELKEGVQNEQDSQ